MVTEPLILPPSSAVPFVGREKEREALSRALGEATSQRGSTWLLEGAGGIGKTRLANWTEEEARRRGFRVRWGRCLKEALAPFFPWQQVFRGEAAGSHPEEKRPPVHSKEASPAELPSVLLVDEAMMKGLNDRLAAWAEKTPTLVVGRERPVTMRQKYPGLVKAQCLWLSRVESDESVGPGRIDDLGERIENMFRAKEGSITAIEGLEYLVSQNSFSAVLSLLQFLHDVAQETGGHLIILVKPTAFEKREVSLLETLGETEWLKAEEADRKDAQARARESEAPTTGPTALVLLHFLDMLENEAKNGPQLVIMDDVQWADPQSILAFQFLARNLKSLPVMLLGTLHALDGRQTEDREEKTVNDVVDEMDREGIVTHMRLKGLSENASIELVRGLLQTPLDAEGHTEELRSFLKKGEGNPYMVLSTARLLAEQGWLQRGTGKTHLVLPEGKELPSALPENAHSSTIKALSLLNAEERSLIDAGAVQGLEFELQVVADVLGRDLDSVERLVRALETRHQMLERTPGISSKAAFTQPLAWEVVLSEIPQEERKGLARKLASWWARTRPTEVDTISRLYHDAGDSREGLPWVEKALEGGLLARSAEAAERFAMWRLEMQAALGTPVDQRVLSGVEVERELFNLSQYQVATRLAELLENEKPSQQVMWEVMVDHARGLATTDVSKAKAILAKIEEEMGQARSQPPSSLVARLRLVECSVDAREGRIDDAVRVGKTSLELLGPEGHAELRCWAMYLIAYALLARGKGDEAEPIIREGLEISRREGRPREEARLVEGQAFLLATRGRLGEAARTYDVSAATFHSAGDIGNEAVAQANRGDVLASLDEWAEADAAYAKSLSLARKFGATATACHATSGVGMVRVREGKWKDAIPHLREACEMCRKGGFRQTFTACLSYLAEAEGRVGNHETALKLWEEARTSATGAQMEDQACVERVGGVLLFLGGNRLEARKALNRAIEITEKGGAWGEGMEAWKNLTELEESAGDDPAAESAWGERNAIRAKVGLPQAIRHPTNRGASS